MCGWGLYLWQRVSVLLHAVPYCCVALQKMAKEIRFAPSFVSSYRDYEAEAHELVQKLIRSSLEKIAAEQAQQKADQSTTYWPLGKDFTTEKGLEAIDKFVKVNHVHIALAQNSVNLFNVYRPTRFSGNFRCGIGRYINMLHSL